MARPHPNVMKIKKQSRMRRAYLKHYSGEIKVPRRVGKSDIPEAVLTLFDYRRRGSTPEFDPYLDAIFPGVKRESKERKYCLDRAEQEKLIDLVTEEADSFVTLREGRITRTRLTYMFNSRYTCNYFVETCTHPSGSYVKKSMVYGSKDRAMFAFEHGRIVWLERVELASLIGI